MMIKVYYLQVERRDNTEKVRGVEFIHKAILNCTEDPMVRKLIQDTTPEEDAGLMTVAIEVREPTDAETDAFNRIIAENPEPTPPLSTHLARLDDINPGVLKPATVTRLFLTEAGYTTIWEGKEWQYDCYVTQSVVTEWQAGDIAVGDIVLTHFMESDINRPLITHKVYKTW